MIRFPERFHASTTALSRGSVGIEPNYQETRRYARGDLAEPRHNNPDRERARQRFDFRALLEALH